MVCPPRRTKRGCFGSSRALLFSCPHPYPLHPPPISQVPLTPALRPAKLTAEDFRMCHLYIPDGFAGRDGIQPGQANPAWIQPPDSSIQLQESNRNIPETGIAVTYSKQTTVVLSNRNKKTPPGECTTGIGSETKAKTSATSRTVGARHAVPLRGMRRGVRGWPAAGRHLPCLPASSLASFCPG
jgi:hypothetical protein